MASSNLSFLRSGPVMKRHLHKKNQFARRTLWLTSTRLYYTDSPKTTPPDGAIVIPLAGSTIDQHEIGDIVSQRLPYYCFTIMSQDRPYTFGVQSYEDAVSWCHDIMNVIQSLRKEGETCFKSPSPTASVSPISGLSTPVSVNSSQQAPSVSTPRSDVNTRSLAAIRAAEKVAAEASLYGDVPRGVDVMDVIQRRHRQKVERSNTEEPETPREEKTEEVDEMAERLRAAEAARSSLQVFDGLTTADIESAFKENERQNREQLYERSKQIFTSADDAIDMRTIVTWVMDRKRNLILVDNPEYNGEFYEDDAYVVLDATHTQPTIYIWCGSNCSRALGGAAAIWAVQLCGFIQEGYDTTPLQIRVDQGDEPDDFIACFGGIFSGRGGSILPKLGIDPSMGIMQHPLPPEFGFFCSISSRQHNISMFREILPSLEYVINPDTGLVPRSCLQQVEPHLRPNTFFIFIHDRSTVSKSSVTRSERNVTVYIYTPFHLTIEAKSAALEQLQIIKSCYGFSRVVVLFPGITLDCDLREFRDELELAMNDAGVPIPDTQGEFVSPDADVAYEEMDDSIITVDEVSLQPELRKVHLGRNGMNFDTEVTGGARPRRAQLSSLGCYYLEWDNILYVWLGSHALKVERAAAIRAAQNSIGPQGELEVELAYEGCEPATFAMCFPDWQPFCSRPRTTVRADHLALRDITQYKPFPAMQYAWAIPGALPIESAKGELRLHDTVSMQLQRQRVQAARSSEEESLGLLDPRIVYHIADYRSMARSGSDVTDGIHYSTDCHATVALDMDSQRVVLFLWRGRFSSPASAVEFQLHVLASIQERLSEAGLAAPELCVVEDGHEPECYINMWREFVGGMLVKLYGATRYFLPLNLPQIDRTRLPQGIHVYRISDGVGREQSLPVFHQSGTYIVAADPSIDLKNVSEDAGEKAFYERLPLVWRGRMSEETDLQVALNLVPLFLPPIEEGDNEQDTAITVIEQEKSDIQLPAGFTLVDTGLRLRPRLVLAQQRASTMYWAECEGVPSQEMAFSAAATALDAGNMLFVQKNHLSWVWEPKFDQEIRNLATELGKIRMRPQAPLPIVAVTRGSEFDEYTACFLQWVDTSLRRDAIVDVGSLAEWDGKTAAEHKAERWAEMGREGVMMKMRVENPPDWLDTDEAYIDNKKETPQSPQN